MKTADDAGHAVDKHLAAYDVRSAHRIEIDAPVAVTYRATRALDMGRSLPVMALFTIRTIPHLLTGKTRPSRSITLETVLGAGFTILEETPPKQLVIGAVGRFWRPDSGLVPITPDEFRGWSEPGFAKAVMSFTVEEHDGGSLLLTETRVACTDGSARRKFSLYWRAIGPFSGLIRRLMLSEVKRALSLVNPGSGICG